MKGDGIHTTAGVGDSSVYACCAMKGYVIVKMRRYTVGDWDWKPLQQA